MSPLGWAAKKILRALEDGPRKPGVVRGWIVRPGDKERAQAEFEQAVGQLFLGGYIITSGRTSGKLLQINGRRTA
jgi:hypothetical protein